MEIVNIGGNRRGASREVRHDAFWLAEHARSRSDVMTAERYAERACRSERRLAHENKWRNVARFPGFQAFVHWCTWPRRAGERAGPERVGNVAAGMHENRDGYEISHHGDRCSGSRAQPKRRKGVRAGLAPIPLKSRQPETAVGLGFSYPRSGVGTPSSTLRVASRLDLALQPTERRASRTRVPTPSMGTRNVTRPFSLFRLHRIQRCWR